MTSPPRPGTHEDAPAGSVQRALHLLTVFRGRSPQLRLGELARATGLPKSSVRRLALTLISSGFLEQHADGTYALGSEVFHLAANVPRHGRIETEVRDVARRLAEATGQTVLIARAEWIELSTLITGSLPGRNHHPSVSGPGRRTPLATGAIGKALLAAADPSECDELIERLLPVRRTARTIVSRGDLRHAVQRSRAQGWATAVDEFIPGVSAVAVPVHIDDRPLGALAVVARSERVSSRLLDEWGMAMKGMLAGR